MENKQLEKGYIQPGKVFGNIYFVGIHKASTHIIDTGDGLIILDPGYAEYLWIVLDNMKKLGLNVKDIKLILLSHGHGDHAGAVKELLQYTDAKVYLGAEDAPMVSGKGAGSLYYVKNEQCFTPDVLIYDGDIIKLGNTEIHCVSTPGHTDGTMSFFFDTTDGKNTYRAGMHGGVGTNTLTAEYLQTNHLPFENRDIFVAGLNRVKDQKVEIFLGNHVGNNDTEGKLKRVALGEENAFYAPEEWIPFLDKRINALHKLIKEESEANK